MVSRVIPVDPFDLVIFGGTGDLARRKILPGLYRRFHAGQVPPEARIVGAARTEQTTEEWRGFVRDAIGEFVAEAKHDGDAIEGFLETLHYVPIDARGDGGWDALKGLMRPGVTQAFYFSVAPSLFGDIALRLHHNGGTLSPPPLFIPASRSYPCAPLAQG